MLFTLSPVCAERVNYSPVPVYRLYNQSNGAHLLTTDENEVKELTNIGWENEAIPFYMPNIETPVKIYRLYNPNNMDHHYTTNENEYESLQKEGWTPEGVAFYGSTHGLHPIYRLWNTKLPQGSHLWTSDDNEYHTLPNIAPDWNREGEAWYAESLTNPTFTYEDQKLNLPSIANSRQLGAYIMPNGKKIKNNILYRSGSLSKVSDEDLQKLHNIYNLKEIADLRAETEVNAQRNQQPSNSIIKHTKCVKTEHNS